MLNHIDSFMSDNIALDDKMTFCDIFAGTASVSKFYKNRFKILSNDSLYLSYVIQKASVENNHVPNFLGLRRLGVDDVVRHFNEIRPEKIVFNGREPFILNYYSPASAEKRKYLSISNAKKIDYVRQLIEQWREYQNITEQEYFYLLAVLIEAVPYVSNIAGTYGAYLKHWDKRALNEIKFEHLEIVDNGRHNESYNDDANEFIRKIEGDILYIDPPYNERQYLPNYHLLETIAAYDDPEPYGVTGMRPYAHQKSLYCSKAKVLDAFDDLVSEAQFKHIVLSYSSEGLMSEDHIEKILKKNGIPQSYAFNKIPYRKYKSKINVNSNLDEYLFYIEKDTPAIRAKRSQLLNLNYLDQQFKRARLPNTVKANIVNAIDTSAKAIISEQVRRYRNAQRIKANDSKKQQVLAKENLQKEEVAKLPEWVKDNFDSAVLIGNKYQVIQVPDGRKYHLKNKLNHLSGAQWTFFINSIINTRFPSSGPEAFAHSIRKIHPSPKPPQLMRDIIEFFTKEGELVLDYFSGVGGTQLGASLCGRRALGIDLNQKYHNAYKKAAQYLELKEQPTITGDSVELMKDGKQIRKHLRGEKFSLILIDPPYGDMMSREKTGQATKTGNTQATPFTNDDRDLGNMSWDKFCKTFKQSLSAAARFLKHDGHVVVFIKDLQPVGDRLNLLHADLIRTIQSITDLQYLGTKIWADQSVNLYPYGYPYSYVANQIHQYILIFRHQKPA